jgi:hypothetical protein
MKKTLKMHEEKDAEVKVTKENEAALPTYLLDRDETNRSKILSNTIKQKRKEKAGKWQVPIPKVLLIRYFLNVYKIIFKANLSNILRNLNCFLSQIHNF